jgi:capsule polysaccharide export protein KpsE/RkpR
MEGYFNNKSFVKVISRWKIHLAVVVVVSAGLGVLFSSEIFITPLYKSTAVVYPVNLYEYSEESTTEQMLQVFRSDDLKKQMLESFDLGKHYELDPKDPHFFTYFMGEYDSHVSVSKTEYESVEITVKDKNPQQASDMVDSLITFFDRKVSMLHQKKQKEAMDIAFNDLKVKRHKMDSLDFVLSEMRKQYGILSYPNQIEDATKAYLNGGGNKTAQDFYKNLQEKGAEFQKMDSLAWYARRDYLYVQNQYETALKEYNKKISYTQVVSSPYPADKKSYPVRWFIVMITTVVSFLSALIVIAFIESKRTPS